MKLFENASWLWKDGYETAENVYIDFFETFEIDAPAENYTMHISADANYAVYVNGTLVNFGQYSDYETYKVYDTITLTGIVPGKNEGGKNYFRKEKARYCYPCSHLPNARNY